MFTPKTDRLKQLASQFPHRIIELESLLSFSTNVYIDYANIRPWSNKLGWHVDLKRLKQFLDSFTTITSTKLYQGILLEDQKSKKLIDDSRSYGYDVRTKPVKIMRLSIDVSSIAPEDSAILKDFIRPPLLHKLTLEAVQFINDQLRELNRQGITYIEDRKCNFDVELGRDMLLDFAKKETEIFVLWSGDSDFAEPIQQLLADGKKVILFATARRIASELQSLREKGLLIFDIRKIRQFICWNKEL